MLAARRDVGLGQRLRRRPPAPRRRGSAGRFLGGDCDRPIVVGKLYNGATSPQNRVHLYSSQTNAYLHLGYLIDHTGNNRRSYLGSGFDLRSDAFGSVRANRGLYVTTYPKPPAGQPLDVQETQQQLRAEGLMEAMPEVSAHHQGESLAPGHSALKQFIDATRNSVSGGVSGGRTAGGGTGSTKHSTVVSAWANNTSTIPWNTRKKQVMWSTNMSSTLLHRQSKN